MPLSLKLKDESPTSLFPFPTVLCFPQEVISKGRLLARCPWQPPAMPCSWRCVAMAWSSCPELGWDGAGLRSPKAHQLQPIPVTNPSLIGHQAFKRHVEPKRAPWCRNSSKRRPQAAAPLLVHPGAHRLWLPGPCRPGPCPCRGDTTTTMPLPPPPPPLPCHLHCHHQHRHSLRPGVASKICTADFTSPSTGQTLFTALDIFFVFLLPQG